MRVDRLLQSQGFGSRKECQALISAGRVQLNGAVSIDADEEFDTSSLLVITIAGASWPYREHLFLALNKPAGIECSHQPTHHKSVFSLLPTHFVTRGLQCVGRLDADTTGLLFLSDDGAFVHAMSSPKRHVPKTYLVTTAEDLTEAQLNALNAPILLRDEKEPAHGSAIRTAPRKLELTIDEGRYHQVKRMLAAVGNRVEHLHRARIGDCALPAELPPGHWLELDPATFSLRIRT